MLFWRKLSPRITNVRPASFRDVLGCSVLVIKQIDFLGFLHNCDGVWTSGPFFFYISRRRLGFLMRCLPFWMRTQWGIEWGLSNTPLPLFLSLPPTRLCAFEPLVPLIFSRIRIRAITLRQGRACSHDRWAAWVFLPLFLPTDKYTNIIQALQTQLRYAFTLYP